MSDSKLYASLSKRFISIFTAYDINEDQYPSVYDLNPSNSV